MIGNLLSNRYSITEKIGQNAFTTTYRAEDTRLKRSVIIKVLNENLTGNEDIRARFLREAGTLARLVHPNLTAIYDVEEEGNTLFIVQEFLEANNLKFIISKHAPLDKESAYRIFRQVAEAVRYAHENGIIHRNIKSQNILVTGDGGVKLADFGLLRTATGLPQDHTGGIVGAIEYLSPEQTQGKPADHTSDIYSMGIVLFEIFTGVLPFAGENSISVAIKQVQEHPPLPSTLNPELNKDIDRVILKALSKEPADRYQKVQEFINDLKNAIISEGRKAVPTTESDPAKAEIESNPENPDEAATDEEEEYDDTITTLSEVAGKNRPLLILLGIIGLLFFLTLHLYLSGGLSSIFSGSVVPDMEGMELSEARLRADGHGWQIQINREIYNSRIPEGVIISQSPRVGAKLPTGGSIYVTISKGKAKIETPDLVGLTLIQAQEQLRSSNLGWIIQERVNSNTVDKDVIISQDPQAGEEVQPGRKVFLTISDGLPQVEVPNLIGMDTEKAKELVTKKDLIFIVEDRKNSTQFSEGLIMSQDPQPGNRIEEGGRLSVVVSMGAKIPIVPDLVGKNLTEAMDFLSIMKIQLNISDGSKDLKARIIGQDPPAGAELKTKVISVWCSNKITVPNLVGRDLGEAQKKLDNSGLSFKVVYVESNQAPNQVIEQQPEGGRDIARGGSVTIVVSRKPEIPKMDNSPTAPETPPANKPPSSPSAPATDTGVDYL